MNARAPRHHHPPSPWVRLWREASRRLFLDRHLEFWLRELSATASLSEVRAQVVDIVQETHDTRTFVLAPNARWPGHRAGQHVTVAVDIEGARVRRCYSLSSAPHARHPTLTVKRVPGGRVSNHLHDRVEVGDVLILEDVGGEFTAPAWPEAPLLFIAGGSGVTPILSMLDALAAQGMLDDAVLLDFVRSDDDVIGRARLDALSAEHPGLRVHVLRDDDPEGPGRFEPSHVQALVPDAAAREAFLCGPPGLMAAVQTWWDSLDTPRSLHREAFTVAAPEVVDGQPFAVTLRDGRAVALSGEGTLLEQLEGAGLSPRHGCRMGICRSCTCRKSRGVVHNLRTGEISDAPDQDIQLCISVPRTDLTLDL